MKRQHYLKGFVRGVGIGIVLTALIMGMTVQAGRPLTDAEIRAKALTLGMVDANSLSLSDVGASAGGRTSPEPPHQPSESGDPPQSQRPEENRQPNDGEETTSPGPSFDEPQMPDEEETPSPSPSSDVTQSSVPEDETVTIVIVRGDSSYTVSRRLEEAGLVENAREYDSYLVDNGYSKTIRTGTYKIPLGATWEEIADIIA